MFGLGLQEMLADEITAELRRLESRALQRALVNGQDVVQQMSSKGIDYGQIVARPDGTVDASGLEGIDDDLRVKPFFAQGGSFSIREFAAGAFKAEMGLETWDPLLAAAAAGQRVETPSGMRLDGVLDAFPAPPASDENDDPDGDGVFAELDPALLDFLEFFLLNSFQPAQREVGPREEAGRQRLEDFGCTSCHIPDLTIDNDRRVIDTTTGFDPEQGVANRLFTTTRTLVEETDDGLGLPPLKTPIGGPFTVVGIYADFKRHDLGPFFWERQFDGSIVREMMTEPLWGVGMTLPYGHDGKSINLAEVIRRHGGEAAAARQAFIAAPVTDQRDLIAFLESLVLFPPADTASDLDPGNPTALDYPSRCGGSIDLSELYNDPLDKEYCLNSWDCLGLCDLP